jgi:DNA-binding beta-propeller fold protein YncE
MTRKLALLLPITLAAALAAASVCDREWFLPYAALVLPVEGDPPSTIPELVLEEKIALGDVKGRIDHMAIDLGRKRLFIAELGNNSVGVVDLQNRKLETRITGLEEPQGIGYVPGADTVFIANGGSGVVDMRRGEDLSLIKKIPLGDDADNIRVDSQSEVAVGYGTGGLVILDAATGEQRQNIPLPAHPESFQLDSKGGRIFVNEPKALRIGVIDRKSGKEIGRWGATGAAANFPMAIDGVIDRLYVAYRIPALITVFDTQAGELLDRRGTCGDADDVFYDRDRKRLYVICGAGSIAVLDASAPKLRELSRLRTRSGARTGLYVPALDRLYVAVPAKGREGQAEIWVYRPI